MFDIGEVERKLKEVLEQEKIAYGLSEEQFELFLCFLGTVCQKVRKKEAEVKEVPLVNDLDERIKKTLKDEGIPLTAGTKVLVSFFLVHGFHDLLRVPPDYYKIRSEILEHSELFQEDPKSPDFLVIR